MIGKVELHIEVSMQRPIHFNSSECFYYFHRFFPPSSFPSFFTKLLQAFLTSDLEFFHQFLGNKKSETTAALVLLMLMLAAVVRGQGLSSTPLQVIFMDLIF